MIYTEIHMHHWYQTHKQQTWCNEELFIKFNWPIQSWKRDLVEFKKSYKWFIRGGVTIYKGHHKNKAKNLQSFGEKKK